MKKILLTFGLLTIALMGFAQGEQAEYLEAKRLFNSGQYLSARAAFRSLTQSESFGKYASFYFALSAYHLEDYQEAADMWRQMRVQFPTWDQKGEVLYWLAMIQFEQQEYASAIQVAEELSEATLNSIAEEALIEKYLTPLPLSELRSLNEQYPENKYLAKVFVRKMNDEPYATRDFVRINQLLKKWEFDLYNLDSFELPVIEKDTYNIAVMLPFLFESLENTTLITQNNLIMDMYQGMQLAASDLMAEEMPVRLLPYDTEKKASDTRLILAEESFKNNDLIIGPLYPGPNDEVDRYSFENQVNKFNPISNNPEVIGQNPFSFLIKPSYETIALKVAELAITENENEYAMIFYEQSERDSVFAALFKERLESAGREVVLYQPITKENSRKLLDTLVAQYDQYLTKQEADSIQKMSGRYVKDRRIRNEELKRAQKDTSFYMPVSYDNDDNKIVYYEKLFCMEPDSVGAILAATRSNLFANNLISAVETRGDSVRLYGYGEWLDFTMLSYAQLDRLNVALSDPEHMDRDTYHYDELSERILKKYRCKPSINHFRGYEIVYYTGKMMHQYGVYFQRGLRSGDFNSGKVFEGYRYGATNDNQVVPVIRFNNAKLEVVNRELYEDREE